MSALFRVWNHERIPGTSFAQSRSVMSEALHLLAPQIFLHVSWYPTYNFFCMITLHMYIKIPYDEYVGIILDIFFDSMAKTLVIYREFWYFSRIFPTLVS